MNRLYVSLSVLVIIVAIVVITNFFVSRREGIDNTTYIGENKFLRDTTGKEVGAVSKYISDVPGNKLFIKAMVTIPENEKGEYGAFYIIDNTDEQVFIGKMQYTDDGKFIIEHKSDDDIWSPMMFIIKNISNGKVFTSTRFV